MNKELKELALDITEQEYRDIPCLHYSALSKYAKDGFNAIEKLDEHVESSSFVFGSLVDTLMTEPEAFNSRYLVAEKIESSDALSLLVKDVFEQYKSTCSALKDVPREALIGEARKASYRNNYKDDTLYNYIIDKGSEYFNFLHMSNGRIIIDADLYAQAQQVVNTLKTDKNTEFLFRDDNPFEEDVKRYYQLKFRTNIDGTEFKCMFDLILVNYKTKEIVPIDLKTLSLKEWDFPTNFKKYYYWIQAKLYCKILKQIISEDEYFKDFTILPFRFVVINKESLIPLIWVYSECFGWNNIETYGNYKIMSLGDMINVLNHSMGRKVPMNINQIGSNELTDFLYE